MVSGRIPDKLPTVALFEASVTERPVVLPPARKGGKPWPFREMSLTFPQCLWPQRPLQALNPVGADRRWSERRDEHRVLAGSVHREPN